MAQIGMCIVCGTVGDVERHHVAGRLADPTFTVDVCPDHHRHLTALHSAAGVPYSGAPPGAWDAARARAVGVLDVLTLRSVLAGHPELALPELAAINDRFAQLAAYLTDVAGPPDRPGRFAPDPRRFVPRLDLTSSAPGPAPGPATDGAAWVSGCLTMLATFAARTPGGAVPGGEHLAAAVGALASRPDVVAPAWSAVLAPVGVPALVALLVRVTDLAADLARVLGSGRPADRVARELAAAIRRLVDVGTALLGVVVAEPAGHGTAGHGAAGVAS